MLKVTMPIYTATFPQKQKFEQGGHGESPLLCSVTFFVALKSLQGAHARDFKLCMRWQLPYYSS